jgi:hypothetical protein
VSKRKIAAAAKRKGLTVVNASWGWTAGDWESYQQWEVQFGPEIEDLFGEDEFQYFEDTTEALKWITGLVSDVSPAVTCEAGQPECGPVEHHDSEGVPLCAGCWAELLADSQSCDSADDAERGVDRG